MQEIQALGKPVILVLLNGSAVAVNWAHDHVPAILDAWYPGEEGGTAIADVIAGDFNPAGRLPVTFYSSVAQLPPFSSYSMTGRTYRYFRGNPLYRFGDGLSFSRFEYRNLQLSTTEPKAGQPLEVRVTVQNTSPRAGDEVVQIYLDRQPSSPAMPFRALRAFRRIHLNGGESKQVSFTLDARQLAFVDSGGKNIVAPGRYTISVGGQQPREAGTASGEVLRQEIIITGNAVEID